MSREVVQRREGEDACYVDSQSCKGLGRFATKGAKRRKPSNKHQPTKAEMEEVIVIPATLDEFAGAVLTGGAPRREDDRDLPSPAQPTGKRNPVACGRILAQR